MNSMMLPTHPENYWQLMARSMKLYRAAFLSVFILALLLSLIAFSPRLLTLYLGKNIFLSSNVFDPKRGALIFVDLISLLFFTAILEYKFRLLTNRIDTVMHDFLVACKKIFLIFLATLIQSGFILLLNISIFGTFFLLHQKYALLETHAGLLLVIIGCVLQFALWLFIYVIFTFYLPLIVVENKGALSALKRSAQLVCGNWFRTLWVQATPWVVYLLCLTCTGFIPHSPHAQAIATSLQILLFALLVPWLTGLLLVQLRDLELRQS